MILLLDTTVASLYVPGRAPSAQRRFFDRRIAGHAPAICFQTAAELWLWAERRRWGDSKRRQLSEFLDAFVFMSFHEASIKLWASITAHSRSIGRPLDVGDGWIAAIAVFYGLPLLTSDRDFTHLGIDGLTVICPE